MKIILKIKEGGHSLPVNKSQTRKDTFANTKVVAIIVVCEADLYILMLLVSSLVS